MDVDAWVEAYRAAWEDRDPEAAARLFAEDSTYRSFILEEPARGPEGVADYWSSVTESQSEVRVRMGRPFEQGSRVAVEFWTTMLSDGSPVTLPGCLLLEFDDMVRCTMLREYWHFVEGHFEPPPEWGT